MASNNIPAGLRSVDIGRFATRAAQVERAKPVVSYWCNFWIVNQIIERGLHASDEEIKLYTTNLVDKLEQFKSKNTENDTVTDNVAAHAYVEQFALEVFNRADAAMTADKVTKQTADTFQAAATFLELCQIWNAPDAETAARIKFAKYHALRIVKAIKAGEDPNASNPVRQDEEEDIEVPQEQVDQDVKAFDASVAEQAAQPSVEEVPDETDRTVPQQPDASAGLPIVPSDIPRSAQSGQSSDLELPSAPDTFASASTSTPQLPDTPSNLGGNQSAPSPVSPSNDPAPPFDPSSFYGKPDPTPPSAPSPSGPSGIHVVPRPAPQPAPAPVHVPAPAPARTAAPGAGSSNWDADDQSISQAQKHARWAVSALTFDDVNTAVRELKNSLKALGAE